MLRTRLFLGLILCLLGSPALGRELAAKLASASHAQAIAVLQIPDLGNLLGKLDRFGAPFSAQFSALFPLVGPSVFRSSRPGELDLRWPVTFVLVAPPDEHVRFAYTAGARNPRAFLEGLGKLGIQRPDGVMSFLAPSGAAFYAAAAGDELLVSDRLELAAATVAAKPVPELLEPPNGDLQLDLYLQRLLTLYAERLDLAEADFFQRLESLHGQPGISTVEMRTFYEMFFALSRALGLQIESLSLGAAFDGGDVVLRGRLRPASDTALARFLADQGTVPERPLVHASREAILALSVSLQTTPELIESLLALADPLGALRSPGEPEPEPPIPGGEILPPPLTRPTPPVSSPEQLRPLYEQLYRNVGPQIGLVVLPMLPGRPGLRAVYTFDYREPEQFLPRLQELLAKVLPNLQASYHDLGWTFDMWLARSPLRGMPEGTHQLEMRFAGLSQEQRAIFDTLYGGPEMRLYLLVVGGKVLVVSGPDAVERMNEWAASLAQATIASQPVGSPPPSGYRVALGFLDLAGSLELSLAALPPAQVQKARAALAPYLETPQRVIFTATTDGQVARLELRYPLEGTLKAYKAATAGQKPR